MRRIALFLALAVATRSAAQAPNAMIGGLSLGPFGGLNYTTFGGSDAAGSDSRTDFALGGQVDYDFIQGGLFRTGLIYSRRGAQTTDNGTTIALKLSYLEVPLLVGYQFPTSTSLRPYVIGGANVGFKTGCSLEGSDGTTSVSVSCDDPNADLENVSSTDFALVGGAGMAMRAGVSSVRFDVRYAYGLTKLVSDANTTNRGFTFGIAYMIPLGR